MSGTVERARGRWREILPLLGVDTRYLCNKHGPCPLCGGRDRFRYDDKDGTGSYICGQCGAGNGLILVKRLNHWDHATACAEIDKIIGKDRSPAPQRAGPDPVKEEARRKARIERTLAEATDHRVVDAFLRKRRFAVTSAKLFGHPACPYYDTDHHLVGHFPAVVAPIMAADGTIESAAQLYSATAPEPRKKFMPKVHTINGAAVRLHDPVDGRLGIAEGIATALAAKELFRVPVWSVLSASGILSFQPPPGLRRLCIFGDNDPAYPSKCAGQKAAYAAAAQLAHADLTVEVILPDAIKADVKTDWADVLYLLRSTP